MKNAFFAVIIFLAILFTIYLSCLANFYEFDKFKFSLNYVLGFLSLIFVLTVSTLNRSDVKEMAIAFRVFFLKNKTIRVGQLKESKTYRVEKIDRKNGITELLYYRETRINVNDLLLFQPGLEVGDFVKREDSFVYFIDNKKQKHISRIS